LAGAKHLQQNKCWSKRRDHERQAQPARLPEIPKSPRNKRIERDDAEHHVAKPDVRNQVGRLHTSYEGAGRLSAGGVRGYTNYRKVHQELEKEEEPELTSRRPPFETGELAKGAQGKFDHIEEG